MKNACPMCHRNPKVKGKHFCSAECQFEWEAYDRYMEEVDPEKRVVYPEAPNTGSAE